MPMRLLFFITICALLGGCFTMPPQIESSPIYQDVVREIRSIVQQPAAPHPQLEEPQPKPTIEPVEFKQLKQAQQIQWESAETEIVEVEPVVAKPKPKQTKRGKAKKLKPKRSPKRSKPMTKSKRKKLANSKKKRASCGRKKTCGAMSSCKEAYHYLLNCGLRRLDRDKNGIPCEKLCQ